jgi:ribosomal protein S18 acetylase RimI-like enzyme
MASISAARTPRYRIRPAVEADARALAAVEQAAFDPARYGGMMINARSFRDHARGPNILLVAADREVSGAVIGYALGFVRRTTPYIRFVSLAVLPEHGGLGAGRLLFEALERAARRQGARGVRLEVRADNRRLLDRYQSIGYRIFQEVPSYYPDGCPAVRLVKDI